MTISLADLAKAKGAEEGVSLTEVPDVASIQKEVENLTPEEREKVDSIKKDIDLTNSQMAVSYGVGAQRELAAFSETILQNVRNRNSGVAGDLMLDLLGQVKDLDVASLGDNKGLLDNIPFLKNIQRKIERFMGRYEVIEVQINQIQGKLEDARMTMLKDITMFDSLYEKNLSYFRDLQLYITAGEEALAELRDTTLPALYQEAEASGEPMDAQLVRDFEDSVNRFEKKIHDLKLSKTLAIQTAPQIRLIQNNNKLLVDKIQTAILNTIPLWKSQIVITIGMFRQKEALELQKSVTETTNKLLTANSEMLKQNTLDIARESEEGIVAIETLRKINDDLITTIEETLKIQEEGRKKRSQAEVELISLEEDLKKTMLKQIENKR